jgi:gas vesicle protein
MLERRFSYFLIGLAAGAGAWALFAPQSGRETRSLIAGQVHRGRVLLAKSGTMVRDSARQWCVQGRHGGGQNRLFRPLIPFTDYLQNP